MVEVMIVLAMILLIALVTYWQDLHAWVTDNPSRAIRSGANEILQTYSERMQDPARRTFPVRPAVVASFEHAFYFTLKGVLSKAGISLESRDDFREEVSAAADKLARALSHDLVEQAKSNQTVG